MWRFLTNMSIARRLMVAAAITALVPGIVISILGSSYVGTLSTVNDTVQAEDNAVKLVTDMQADLLRMNALLGTLSSMPNLTTDTVQNSREISQLTEDFSSTLATYQQGYQITTSAKMASIRDALKNDSQGSQEPVSQHSMIYVVNLQWKMYSSAQQKVLDDVQQNASAGTLSGDIARANLEYLPLKGNLDNLVTLTESISQIVTQINTFKIYPILFWTIAAFLFSTLVVFAISYVINLTITRPLRQLVHLTERIAQGDTSARALVIGHDEIYMVATSMNTMLDNIVNLMKNIQRQHDFLEDHVQKIIDEIKGLGSGDLRSRVEVTSDALGFLAHSFNYMLDDLSSLVKRIKTIANEVEMSNGTAQSRVMQLVQSNTHQIQDITEATMAVERMAKSTFTITEQSQILVTTARETFQMVKNRQEVARRVEQDKKHLYKRLQSIAEQLPTLEESAKQIDTFIADLQTNYLKQDSSASASVESKNKAGLALIIPDRHHPTGQNKDHATLMSTLIKDVRERIVNVTNAMRETDEEIAHVMQQEQQIYPASDPLVDQINLQIQAAENINMGLNQQLHLSQTILQVMQNAVEANKKSSESTHEATYTIKNLTQLVSLLHSSVSTFKLREEYKATG